jgi:serine/threonine protein kinase
VRIRGPSPPADTGCAASSARAGASGSSPPTTPPLRRVALATVKTEGLDEAGLLRVRREAQAMALLGDHPHIVTIHDIGDEDGRALIVSQFMSGGSVEDLLTRAERHRLPIDEALRVGLEVASTLEHAHSRGVVHRDLKPANVWLTDDGSARLGDFGLAVAADHSRITSEGMMVGTVAYMAPEQALGSDVGPAGDLYSLARCSTRSSLDARRSWAATPSRSSPSTSTPSRWRRGGTTPTSRGRSASSSSNCWPRTPRKAGQRRRRPPPAGGDRRRPHRADRAASQQRPLASRAGSMTIVSA